VSGLKVDRKGCHLPEEWVESIFERRYNNVKISPNTYQSIFEVFKWR
jgi:hypothetical protein